MEAKKKFLTNRDLEALGIRAASTSRNLQWQGKDPLPHYKIGKTTRYAIADIKCYLAKNKIENVKI